MKEVIEWKIECYDIDNRNEIKRNKQKEKQQHDKQPLECEKKRLDRVAKADHLYILIVHELQLFEDIRCQKTDDNHCHKDTCIKDEKCPYRIDEETKKPRTDDIGGYEVAYGT